MSLTPFFQFSYLHAPSLPLSLSPTQAGVADKFVNDLKSVVAEIMKDPHQKPTGSGAIYGMAQTVPDRSVVQELCEAFMDLYYQAGPVKEDKTN